MNPKRRKVAAALGIGGLSLVSVGTIHAQDIRVNVTGTNIKRVDTETAAPIETITRQDIQESGLQTISDVVRRITANSNGTIANEWGGWGFTPGASAVSLRGLGSNNTLVLLNGRRLGNYGLADDGHLSFVDLNQIPFDAVERIEILKDGASAIYGSDAVAGVVNIILRQQYTGFTATATAGTTYKWDGEQFRGSLTWGMGDLTKDRYNFYITLDAQKQKAMASENRPDYIGTSNLEFMGLPDTRPGNPPLGWGTTSPLGNVRPVAGDNLTGPTQGPYQSLPGYCEPKNQSDGFCKWDLKGWQEAQNELEKYNIFARGAYNFTPTTQGYTELSYFRSKLYAPVSPSPLRTFWPDVSGERLISSLTTINLPVGHPDNPFSADGQGARLYYVPFDVGPRVNDVTSDTQRYLAGVKGSNGGWDWDVAGLYIRTDTDVGNTGLLNYPNLLDALAGRGGFGYYRVGANASLNNPGIYGFIAPALTYTSVAENTQFDAKASRDVFKLQGGMAALAVGYEWRREEVDNPGVPGTFEGNIVGYGYSAATGSRNINALFGELYMPILKTLEATVAIRYDDYSDFGSTWNPKVGVKWTPIPSLVLRGTYATGFRAPGLYENGNSASSGYANYIDPVRCPVTDSPADCGAGQVAAITFGNTSIQPERSTNWTIGLVWEPVPAFNMTLDYWNIETKDQIVAVDPQPVIDNPGSFPNDVVIRDPNDALPDIPDSGTILAVAGPFANLYKTKTDGIDISARYRWNPRDWGMFTAQLEYTYINSFKRTYSNGDTFQFAGTHGPTSLSSAAGMPRDKANLALTWERGPWNVTGTVRYIAGMDDIESDEQPDCLTNSSLGVEGFCTVSSFTTLDLSASYRGFKNWEIFGSIINVFNRQAPFDYTAGYGLFNYNFNYAFSGVAGTQFNLGVRYTFN
ncbi:MAG: TonB-dependent receptor [Burkholderiales bacterium]|nr:TonB-dependent receptor [Burkholderiales bacterium]